MPPSGFEPTISAGEKPKTYALDRAATAIGLCFVLTLLKCYLLRKMKHLINPLNAELNPICHLLALGAHHIVNVGRIRVNAVAVDEG
jgi:hypothetical protein